MGRSTFSFISLILSPRPTHVVPAAAAAVLAPVQGDLDRPSRFKPENVIGFESLSLPNAKLNRSYDLSFADDLLNKHSPNYNLFEQISSKFT